MEKCLKCKSRDAFFKKRQLCQECYRYLRRHNELKTNPSEIQYNNEVLFIRNYFNHKNWIYQPTVFHLNSTRYTPDFYDAERNEFIEVIGSRQAFHENKNSYNLFFKLYPKIILRFFEPSGHELSKDAVEESVNGGRLKWEPETDSVVQ